MKVIEKIVRCRLVIALVLIILGVAFNINGSSFSLWSVCSPPYEDTGLIAGEARDIRIDEWGCLTPMTLSQARGEHPFSWFSYIIRGGNTDVFMVYSLPVRTPAIIFHPFLIGYLIFGMERGLSFFWCARLVFLILVSFDFFRLLTKNDYFLSLGGALLVAFSPAVQWWFAINAFVEMLIFGEVIILCADKLMREGAFAKRAGYAAVIAWSAGCYALTLYPAWMIPLAYVFLAVFIWVIAENRRDFSPKARDIGSWVIALAGLFACMAAIVRKSGESIRLVMNTVYPGKRVVTGGGYAKMFFFYPGNIFFPRSDIHAVPVMNVSDDALFFSFAPLGLILTVYFLIRKKGKDLPGILLLAVYALLAAYISIGLPAPLASATLLSKSGGIRAAVILSFLDIILLLYSVSGIRQMRRNENNIKPPLFVGPLAVGLSAALSVILVQGSVAVYGTDFITPSRAWHLALLLFAAFLAFIFYAFMTSAKATAVSGSAACALAVGTALLCGTFVNPLQQGIGGIYGTDLAKEVTFLVEAEPEAKWISGNGINYPTLNYPLMMGAPTLNGTNTYPNMGLWQKLDPTGQYEPIYNRYAHVYMDIVPADEIEDGKKFALDNSIDTFRVKLTTEDIRKLGISYVFTSQDISSYSDDTVTFEKVFFDGLFYIFAVR